MRREGRMPAAAMDRKSGMRRDAYRDVGGRPRLEQSVEGTMPKAARRRPESSGLDNPFPLERECPYFETPIQAELSIMNPS